MPTPETEQWLAIKAHLDTMPGSLTVYGPDDAVTPPGDGTGQAGFILVSDTRNEPQRFGIQGQRRMHRESGTLILSIHWPVSRPISYTQLREMQGQIVEHFPADLRMSYKRTCLRVTQLPSTLEPYRDDVYRVCVVRVPWSTV